MRGMNIAPHAVPAQTCDTRIQHELFSSLVPTRSHGNCTLMRPYWSVVISSPDAPTTTAVCGPRIIGSGVVLGRRKVVLPRIASSEHRKVSISSPSVRDSDSATLTEHVVRMIRYSVFVASSENSDSVNLLPVLSERAVAVSAIGLPQAARSCIRTEARVCPSLTVSYSPG